MDNSNIQQARLPQEDPEQYLYLKILNDFPALIWRAGTDGMCDWFNATWLEFTGRSLVQEQGNGWAEGVHPEDLDFCVQNYLDHFARRQGFSMEYRLKHHDGSWRWILDIGRPFYSVQDEFLGYIGSCYDITDQKNMTLEMSRLGEMRDRIFSIIGHDLRNMSGIIQGMSEMALRSLESGNTEECREYLGLIRSTSGNSLHLLNNLLEWGKSRSGTKPMNLVALDPVPVIRDTLRITAPALESKKLTARLDAPEPGVLSILGDADYVATILRNLVSNAIKFTPRGGSVTVSIGTVVRDGQEQVCLSVRDTGTGMEPGVLETIRRGAAAKSARGTENEGGSGFGLSLCTAFLQAMKGEMTVESAPGKGSQFSVYIPPAPKG